MNNKFNVDDLLNPIVRIVTDFRSKSESNFPKFGGDLILIMDSKIGFIHHPYSIRVNGNITINLKMSHFLDGTTVCQVDLDYLDMATDTRKYECEVGYYETSKYINREFINNILNDITKYFNDNNLTHYLK